MNSSPSVATGTRKRKSRLSDRIQLKSRLTPAGSRKYAWLVKSRAHHRSLHLDLPALTAVPAYAKINPYPNLLYKLLCSMWPCPNTLRITSQAMSAAVSFWHSLSNGRRSSSAMVMM